jgi:hypothetical protein
MNDDNTEFILGYGRDHNKYSLYIIFNCIHFIYTGLHIIGREDNNSVIYYLDVSSIPEYRVEAGYSTSSVAL